MYVQNISIRYVIAYVFIHMYLVLFAYIIPDRSDKTSQRITASFQSFISESVLIRQFVLDLLTHRLTDSGKFSSLTWLKTLTLGV